MLLNKAGRATVTISGKEPFSIEFSSLETSGRILRLVLKKPLTQKTLGDPGRYYETKIETAEHIVRGEFWSPGQSFYDGEYQVDFMLSKTAEKEIQVIKKGT